MSLAVNLVKSLKSHGYHARLCPMARDMKFRTRDGKEMPFLSVNFRIPPDTDPTSFVRREIQKRDTDLVGVSNVKMDGVRNVLVRLEVAYGEKAANVKEIAIGGGVMTVEEWDTSMFRNNVPVPRMVETAIDDRKPTFAEAEAERQRQEAMKIQTAGQAAAEAEERPVTAAVDVPDDVEMDEPEAVEEAVEESVPELADVETEEAPEVEEAPVEEAPAMPALKKRRGKKS